LIITGIVIFNNFQAWRTSDKKGTRIQGKWMFIAVSIPVLGEVIAGILHARGIYIYPGAGFLTIISAEYCKNGKGRRAPVYAP
jgi:hypothetical protein